MLGTKFPAVPERKCAGEERRGDDPSASGLVAQTGRKLMRRRAAPAHMSTRGRVPNISLKTFKEEVIG